MKKPLRLAFVSERLGVRQNSLASQENSLDQRKGLWSSSIFSGSLVFVELTLASGLQSSKSEQGPCLTFRHHPKPVEPRAQSSPSLQTACPRPLLAKHSLFCIVSFPASVASSLRSVCEGIQALQVNSSSSINPSQVCCGVRKNSLIVCVTISDCLSRRLSAASSPLSEPP